MHQQFPWAQRIMVPDAAMIVNADVHADNPKLALFDPGVAVLEVNMSRSKRFHFCPLQRDARFKALNDLIFMIGFAIGGDCFCSGLVQGATPKEKWLTCIE